MSKEIDKASRSLDKLGSSAQKMGGMLTAGITLPVIAAGAAMFKTFANYEATMAELQARTRATAEEMELMDKAAIKMGRDTMFSASQAAEAMLELTASGSSAVEAIEILPDVLDLAAAGALELGQAADGVTDVMKMFQLETKDTKSIVDALSKAAGSSSANIEDMLAGFSNVGPVAHQFGLSVNDTAAALAVFAENGIKSAESGTQLRSMLLNMTRNTEAVQGAWNELGVSMFDSAGNFRKLDDVFKDINAAMQDMNMQDQARIGKELAGSYGIIGFNALRAANGISGMQSAMQNAASAEEVADARTKTLIGAWTALMGSVETLGIQLGKMSNGPLVSVIMGLTNMLNKIGEFATAHPVIAQTIMMFIALAAAVGPVLMVVGTLMRAWSGLSAAFTAISGILPALTALFAGLTAPMLVLIGLLALIAAGIGWMIKNKEKVAAIPEVWGKNFKMLGEIIGLLAEKFDLMKVFGAILKEAMLLPLKPIMLAWQALPQGFRDIATQIMQGLIGGIKAKMQEWWNTIKQMAQGAVDQVKKALKIQSPSKVFADIGGNVAAGFQEGVKAMGGLGVNVPQAGMSASGGSSPTLAVGGASGGGVNINIGTIQVPPGTSQEQIRHIMNEIGKHARRNGARN